MSIRPLRIQDLPLSASVSEQHLFLVATDNVFEPFAEVADTADVVYQYQGVAYRTPMLTLRNALQAGTAYSGAVPDAAPQEAETPLSDLPVSPGVPASAAFPVLLPGYYVSTGSGNTPPYTFRVAPQLGARLVTYEALSSLLGPVLSLGEALTAPGPYIDDTAAASAGVPACNLYAISDANPYGIVSGGGRRVVRLAGESCPAAYASDAGAAAGGIAVGAIYLLSEANIYGVVSGGHAVAVRTDDGSITTVPGPFASDAEAALAGVVIGQVYRVKDANIYGIEAAGGRSLARRLT